MAKKVSVFVDLKGLKKYGRVVKTDLRGTTQGPIRMAITQWAARYRAFLRRRFVKYSRGGGDWASLKRKRKRGTLKRAAILRNTGILFGALQVIFQNKPGAIQRRIPFGVRVGYGGPQRHGKGKATVADIASFHQRGAGRLPERKIIVDPDIRTISRMQRDMGRGVKRLEKATNIVKRKR